MKSNMGWSVSGETSGGGFSLSISSTDDSPSYAGAVMGTIFGTCSACWAGKWAGRISGIYYPFQSSFPTNPIMRENVMRFVKLGMLKGARNGGYTGFLMQIFFLPIFYAAGHTHEGYDSKKIFRFVNSAVLAGTISGGLTGILAGGLNGTVAGAVTGIALGVIRHF